MPDFVKTILYDNYDRAVVHFLYNGANGTSVAYGLSGTVEASSLTAFDTNQATGSTNVNINVSKVFWSLPQGSTGTAVELSWGVSGSITGTPFLYLNGNGYVNFVADGMYFSNTDTSINRRNLIKVRNTNTITSTDTISVILELDKNGGYVRRVPPIGT